MRKWKDNENNIYPVKFTRIVLLFAFAGFSFPFIDYFFRGHIYLIDIFDALGAAFLIWCVKFNGFYKMGRKLSEWYLKTKDNKWRYYSK